MGRAKDVHRRSVLEEKIGRVTVDRDQRGSQAMVNSRRTSPAPSRDESLSKVR
jgi:hypothetical protein